MKALILQKLVPLLTTFALFLNSLGGMLGIGVIIPYNPERVDVAVSGDVITDVDKIVARYNEAVNNSGFVIASTRYDKFEISNADYGKQNDSIASLMDIYIDSFTSTVTYSFEVPGNRAVLASDIKSAKMSEKDGETTIILELVNDYAALARVFGWDEDESTFEDAFKDTGFIVSMGDSEMSYDNITVSCIIDDNGKIIYGDWDYDFRFSAKNIEAKISDMEMTFSFDLDCTVAFDI